MINDFFDSRRPRKPKPEPEVYQPPTVTEEMLSAKTLENIKRITNKGEYMLADGLLEKASMVKGFTVAGLAVGFVYGMYRKKNLLWTSLIGGLACGIIGYFIKK
jgi:hypothetical protein